MRLTPIESSPPSIISSWSNLTPQTAAFQSGLQPPAGPPFQGWLESPYEFGSNASNYSGGSSSAVSNNQVNSGLPLGAYHAIWAISRTTPYSNFACFANGQPNNCDDNLFQFLDVIDASMISQCCANGGNPASSGVPNCGQYNGGNGASPCGQYITTLGPSAAPLYHRLAAVPPPAAGGSLTPGGRRVWAEWGDGGSPVRVSAWGCFVGSYVALDRVDVYPGESLVL